MPALISLISFNFSNPFFPYPKLCTYFCNSRCGILTNFSCTTNASSASLKRKRKLSYASCGVAPYANFCLPLVISKRKMWCGLLKELIRYVTCEFLYFPHFPVRPRIGSRETKEIREIMFVISRFNQLSRVNFRSARVAIHPFVNFRIKFSRHQIVIERVINAL